MKGFIFRANHCYRLQICASYRSAVTFGTEESHIEAISSRKSSSLGNEIRPEVRVCNYCGTTLNTKPSTQMSPTGGDERSNGQPQTQLFSDTRFASK